MWRVYGMRVGIITLYDTNRNNAKRYTALLLKPGGLEAAGAKVSGIHWHVSQAHRVTYMPEKRERNDHSNMQIMGHQFEKQFTC